MPESPIFATQGVAISAPEARKDELRVVYLALGEVESGDEEAVVGRIRRSADVDFEGTIEQGLICELTVGKLDQDGVPHVIPPDEADSTVQVVARLCGEQSELFEAIKEIALLEPADGGQAEQHLHFEEPYRWEVATRRRPAPSPLDRSVLDGAVLLGEGHLVWPSRERQTDRYGLISLIDGPSEDAVHVPLTFGRLPGRVGRLVAEVLATDETPRDGDVFRWIMPTLPTVGEIFELGHGTVIADGDCRVGCQPDDGREIDWLAPAALYRANMRVVRLWLIPEL